MKVGISSSIRPMTPNLASIGTSSRVDSLETNKVGTSDFITVRSQNFKKNTMTPF